MPRVTAIVVTYFSKPHIDSCLKSLKEFGKDEIHEIRVVDNASTDGTTEWIRENYSQVSIVRNGSNLGFSKACNIGSKNSNSEYLLFLNPDARLEAGALREMLLFLDGRCLAAMCGPLIENDRGEFQFSCRRGLPTPANSLGRLFGIERLFPRGKFGSYSLLHVPPDREMKVEAISGGCMLVRTKDYDEIGGFDEDYFLFGEDLDLCWKLGKRNREIWYIPSAKVMHVKGASVRFNFSRSRREFFRAMDIYIDKRLKDNYSFLSRLLMKAGLRVRRIMDPLMRG